MKPKLVSSFFAAGALAAAFAAADEPPQADRVEVGQKAPAFSLPSSDGETTYSLADLSGEKDLVLVFFRGSW